MTPKPQWHCTLLHARGRAARAVRLLPYSEKEQREIMYDLMGTSSIKQLDREQCRLLVFRLVTRGLI